MNVDLLSLDPGSSLAANLPRHNSRPGECGCRHQSSCHTLKGRAPHLHPASTSPGGKVSAKEPRRFPGLQRRQSLFRVITYGNALTFPPNYPNTVVPGKYSVQSHRLVIFKLGKSHCTVFICYSMPEFCFWFIWKSLVYCTSSLLTVRITCAGAIGVFSWPKTEIHFGRKMCDSAASPWGNCTVIYTCRGDWLLCIEWSEPNDLKIYVQKGM